MNTHTAVGYEQLCDLVADMEDLKGLLSGVTEFAASAMAREVGAQG